MNSISALSDGSPRIELDVVAHAQAAQPARRLGRAAARVEARHVRLRHRAIEHAGEVADVVGLAHRRAVGEPVGADEGFPAQREPVDAERAGGIVHRPLQHVDRLRPPGTAIGVDLHGVGVDPLRGHEAGLHVVAARHDLREQLRLDVLREVRVVSPEVRDVVHPVGDQPVALVEAELRMAHEVAAAVVRQHRLRAVRHPAHRATQHPSGDRDEQRLGIGRGLHPEAAADVGVGHAHVALGQPELLGEQALDPPHPLPVHADVEPPVLDLRPGSARLERGADDAVVVHRQLDDMRRRGQRRLAGRLVALGEVVGDVVGGLRVERLAARGDVELHRPVVPVDLDRLGRVAGLVERVGHHEGHRLAHEPHPPVGQQRPPRIGRAPAVAVGRHGGRQVRDDALLG